MSEFLKPEEIAKIIAVDVSTVRRWLRDGQLPYYKFGRAVRIKSKDFEAYVKANEVSLL